MEVPKSWFRKGQCLITLYTVNLRLFLTRFITWLRSYPLPAREGRPAAWVWGVFDTKCDTGSNNNYCFFGFYKIPNLPNFIQVIPINRNIPPNQVKLEPFNPIVHPTGGTYCHVIDHGHVKPSAARVNIPGENLLHPGILTRQVYTSGCLVREVLPGILTVVRCQTPSWFDSVLKSGRRRQTSILVEIRTRPSQIPF